MTHDTLNAEPAASGRSGCLAKFVIALAGLTGLILLALLALFVITEIRLNTVYELSEDPCRLFHWIRKPSPGASISPS
jgi:hypothetical protein